MKRFVFTFLTTIICYFIYGLLISQYNVNVLPESLEQRQSEGFYDYSGVINVHTNLSSGSGSHEKVIQSAKTSGLDFLFFTDLNDFERPKEIEGYYENLLVFVDGEYSYLDSRILNIGSRTGEHLKGVGQSQAFFADLLGRRDRHEKYGLFLLSHPYKPKFEWKGELPEGLDGIEVLNLRTMWQSAYLHRTLSFIWTLMIYPFNSDLAFIRLFENIPEKELALWDQLTQKRKAIAIVGSDAWANANLFFTQLEFPTYKTVFSLARNHVLLQSELTGNPEKDKEKILNALEIGQFYFALDSIANPKGFTTFIKNSNDEIFPLGSELDWVPGLDLKVTLPEKPLVPFDVVIYKDGQKMMSSNSKETSFRIQEPGIYRIMVRVIPTFPLPDGKKWTPWIFTNSFYVR